MRILHIIPDYFNTNLYRLLIAAQHSYCETRVYAMDNVFRQCDEPEVYCAPKAFSSLQRLLFFPKQKTLLDDIERRRLFHDIDVIHAHTLFSSGNVAYNLHRKYGIPYVVAVRDTDVNVFMRYMLHLRPLGRKIAANAAKIIFISPAYRDAMCGRYFDEYCAAKSVVLPNGIDDIFLCQGTPRSIEGHELKLICVGQITKRKNVETTLRVVDTLVSQGRKVTLTLVGNVHDEPYRDMIERRPYCRWFPHCAKEDVLKHLRRNDIFIMPSHTETFGLVYAEAISQGLPVIYTRGQGFDGHFADGEVGFAVPDNDVDYIVRKIRDIEADYNAMSVRCVAAAQRFNWHALARQYSLIYSQAVGTAK